MAPANEFPGNIFFYVFFVGFVAFFAWSVAVRLRWVRIAKPVNRFDRPIERAIGLIPWLVGNARVARPKYWYSGLLHTMIWWGFIVLQIRTLNFLLNGVHEDITIEAIAGDDGQIVTPHHCRQALSTDDADPPAGLTLQR